MLIFCRNSPSNLWEYKLLVKLMLDQTQKALGIVPAISFNLKRPKIHRKNKDNYTVICVNSPWPVTV